MIEISESGKKRLIQAGFIAGLSFLDNKYRFPKELSENELENIKKELSKLFEKYGLSKDVV